MKNDIDVGSLIINSAEKLTPLRNLAYLFQLQIKVESNIATTFFYNTKFKWLNILEGRSDQINI